MYRRIILFHIFTDSCQLTCRCLSCILLLKNPRRFLRQRRPVFPDLADQITGIDDLSFLPRRYLLISKPVFHSCRTPVKPDIAAVFQRISQILFNCRNTRLSHLHHIDSCSLKLLRRLYEVSSIHPQLRLVGRNDSRSCRTGEIRDILPCFKIFANILGLMEIRSRHNININLFFFHLLTQF